MTERHPKIVYCAYETTTRDVYEIHVFNGGNDDAENIRLYFDHPNRDFKIDGGDITAMLDCEKTFFGGRINWCECQIPNLKVGKSFFLVIKAPFLDELKNRNLIESQWPITCEVSGDKFEGTEISPQEFYGAPTPIPNVAPSPNIAPIPNPVQ